MRGQVLVVEDDGALAEIVALVLSDAGMGVATMTNGADALRAFHDGEFDLVILDVMLPGMDGFDLCSNLRRESLVPIMMLTARAESGDIVRGLECGADDYVTKPFETGVLLARVRAVLRRARPDLTGEMLNLRGVRIDLGAFRAWHNDAPLELTATEFRLLTELLRHAGHVLTREVLLRLVWNYDYLGDSRLVDMAVKRLRGKIETDGTRLITTVRGVGYRFEPT